MRTSETADLQKVMVRMPVSIYTALMDLKNQLNAQIPSRPGRRSVSLNSLCILAAERILSDPPSPREI